MYTIIFRKLESQCINDVISIALMTKGIIRNSVNVIIQCLNEVIHFINVIITLMLWWVVLSVYISPLYFLNYCRRLNVSCGNFRTHQVKGITMSAYSTYFSLLFISKFTFTNYCPNVRKILYLYIDMGFKWMGLLSVCLSLVVHSVLFSIVNMGFLFCTVDDTTRRTAVWWGWGRI